MSGIHLLSQNFMSEVLDRISWLNQATGSATRSSEQAKYPMVHTDDPTGAAASHSARGLSPTRTNASNYAAASASISGSPTMDLRYWINHVPAVFDLKGLIDKGDRICNGMGGYSEVFKGTMRTAEGQILVRVLTLVIISRRSLF